MKLTSYPELRIVLTMVAGIFMIIYPERILAYLAVLLGLLFIIPGATQLLRYIVLRFKRMSRSRSTEVLDFPVVATIAMLVGGAIIAFSGMLSGILSLLLAVLLIVAGGYEVVSLIGSKSRGKIGVYILPVLIMLLGVFILINPMQFIPCVIMTMFGIGGIVYSISEIIHLIAR